MTPKNGVLWRNKGKEIGEIPAEIAGEEAIVPVDQPRIDEKDRDSDAPGPEVVLSVVADHEAL